MDNGAMENFFGRLKVEMFYGETFSSTDEFIRCLKDYIDYYNNERIILKLKMSPVQYRTHSRLFCPEIALILSIIKKKGH